MRVPADVAREMARVAARARVHGPAHALARVDRVDQRRGRAPRRIRRRGRHDGRRGHADRRARPAWARLVFAAGRRTLRVGRSFGPRMPMAGDEQPAALLTLAAEWRLPRPCVRLTGLPAKIKWPNDVVDRAAEARRHSGRSGDAGRHAPVHRARLRRQPASRPRIRPSSPRVTTSIEAETNRPAERAIDACRNSCGAGRALRRSAGRKVRCYSERLATACGVAAWRASRMGLAGGRRSRPCGRHRSTRRAAGARRRQVGARGRGRSAVARLRAES